MKKIVCLSLILLLGACNNNNDRDNQPVGDNDTEAVSFDLTPVWTYEFDTATGDNHMKSLRTLNKEETAPTVLINILNNTFDSVQVAFQRISHDTLYVSIPNSAVLTQRMGSTGAKEYMAVATYTLTEAYGIHYVHFSFVEGDHAEPGTYSREQFKMRF